MKNYGFIQPEMDERDFFDGSFEHTYTWSDSGAGTWQTQYWWISNTIGTRQAHEGSNLSFICNFTYNDVFQYLQERDVSTNYNDYNAYTLATTYYVTTERDDDAGDYGTRKNRSFMDINYGIT